MTSESSESSVGVEVSSMLAAMKTVKTCNRSLPGAGEYRGVTCNFGAASTVSYSAGSVLSESRIESHWDGADDDNGFRVFLDFRFLTDVFASASGDYVEVRYFGHDKAVVFIDGRTTWLLMPMFRD